MQLSVRADAIVRSRDAHAENRVAPPAEDIDRPAAATRLFLSTLPAESGDRKLALLFIVVSVLAFAALAPFAKTPLAPVPAFIPLYQSALVVGDLLTALLLLGQYRILRSRALLFLGSAYLFTGCIAVSHTLSFPGLFAPGGLLGAGPQTTAWLYMFWHAGFPLLVIAYVASGHDKATTYPPNKAIAVAVAAVAALVAALTVLATSGREALPAIMEGNHYTRAMIIVVSSVWALSVAALIALWRRRPHTVLDLWLMVVVCAWVFDIALAAMLNAGRFDLGFYAGRIYGLVAASFVLVVLLVENARLYARLAAAHAHTQRTLERHSERLQLLHEIDQALIAEKSTAAIAAAVVQPLRELLGVSRVIVNRFDLAAGEVEWIAAAGRRRIHVGPGVRYSIRMMGDLEALKRGETQIVSTRALPQGRDTEALLASGVDVYMVVPMIAGGELLGALSFGGDSERFLEEQEAIAREVATQLAIAMTQAQLLARVKDYADQLESRVLERTAELEVANKDLASFSYSVSHDLRAPLRAVDGYAQMLEEDYAARLDDEGRRMLAAVRGNSQRMGQLIDDLLAFSRLGRQAVAKQPVDMAVLVNEVCREAAGNAPVSISVGPLPPTRADPRLLKQALLNLVANAVKYSSKRDDARVEIAGSEDISETLYWVRDNGAGFDMRYAAKLFGVFQRLHSQEEFPGTGVGLAIVQRVVTRHGGRVWAEGKPGEGACFYLALPREG